MLVAFNRHGLAIQPHGGELRDLGVPASRTWLTKFYYFIQRVIRLRRLKSEFRPDVSISFLEGADYVNLLSSVGEKIFFYVHGSKVHDHNVRGVTGWLRRRFFIPFCYQRASAILVVNKRLEEEYRRAFSLRAIRFYTFPNFYDFDKLRNLAAQPVGPGLEELFSNHAVICIMGRLAREKGVDQFLRLLPSLLARQPSMRLLLVGDGPDEEKIVGLAKEMALPLVKVTPGVETFQKDAVIIMTGYQANPYRLLAKSRMLALPSLNEGMPNSLVEAMGLGVPVAAANCPYGPAELLSPSVNPPHIWPGMADHGILLPTLNEPAAESVWVDALDKLLTDSTLRGRLQENGLRYALEFSEARADVNWQKLLENSL